MSVGGVAARELDDLSKLSDAERGFVLDVLRRDEHLRQQEFTRIEVLKSEVEALKQRLALNASDDRVRSRGCSLCSASFGWIFGRGDICRRCQETRVCGSCRQTTTTIEGWICLLCYKKQQLYLKSGSWFHRTFSGRRRLRRLTESECSTLTFRKDIDRTNSVGIDSRPSPAAKSFSSATLPRTALPTPNASTLDGVASPGKQLSSDAADGCAYPDEDDRQLLMLLSTNLTRKDEVLSTDVGFVPASQPQDHGDSVARRRTDAEVFRRGHLASKRCLSDEWYPERLRNNQEHRGIRSYRTCEDLSGSFREDGSEESTKSNRIWREASDAEPESRDGSISIAVKSSEGLSWQNEAGDTSIGNTSGMEQGTISFGRCEPNRDESHILKEFQSSDLSGTERRSPGTERRSPGTERRSSATEPESSGTARRSHVTNDSASGILHSWSGFEASFEEFSPEIARQEVESRATDGSRSNAEESLISVRSEDLNSRTLELELDLLAWKTEIEQLFQGPSLTYDQDWEEEIDSQGVLRDVANWSESSDGEMLDGTDHYIGNGFQSLPPLEDVTVFVLDQAHSIEVEVAEEDKGMSHLSLQPKRYLRVFNDEDSLSIISERTEPTCSDRASVDLDLPASESGWHSDAFSASDDDDDCLGVTQQTDAGIDRAIDIIVYLEAQLFPPTSDLDAEMDRLVAENREHQARTVEMSTLTMEPVDELRATCTCHDPGYFEQKNGDNKGNTSSNRSSHSLLHSESDLQLSAFDSKPGAFLPSRSGDLGDAITSEPMSNHCPTVANHNCLIISPQSLSDSSAYPPYNVREREYRVLEPLWNGARPLEEICNSAGSRKRSEVRRSNGELLSSEAITSKGVDRLIRVSYVDEQMKEFKRDTCDGYSVDDGHSSDWKNFDNDEKQRDVKEISMNQTKSMNHWSGKQ